MNLELNTPALLFPALSLLMLAYTNRFLALSSLIRTLHHRYRENGERVLALQIHRLKQRLVLIRNMQALGVSSMFLCVLSMLAIFEGWHEVARLVFSLGLILLLASLSLSLAEITISVNALNIQLADLQRDTDETTL
jgi:hypothetical protein